MIGASYLGWAQWLAASQNPPHLVCMIPNVAPPDPFYNFPYEYGVFFLQGAIWWAEVVESEATADISGGTLDKIFDREYGELLRSLPVIDLDVKILGKENRYWRNWIMHPTRDDYWESACHLDKLAQARIPVFHQSGWFDGDGIGSKLNYLAMASHGHPHQKLVLGPWGHTDTATRKLGDIDFGPKAIVDLQTAYLRWFDHWLKGIDNGIDREPLVSLFVMGTNEWIHGNTYPLEGTRFDKWYLASGGQANTSKGDGTLSRTMPAADSPADSLHLRPRRSHPRPDRVRGGRRRPRTSRTRSARRPSRRTTRRCSSAAQDILVYTSEPFDRAVHVRRPGSAMLYAATSAKDTDWFVRLDEVTRRGRVLLAGSRPAAARFRNGVKTTELLQPDEVSSTSSTCGRPRGRSQRAPACGSRSLRRTFPLFSRNLNTGGHNETETEFLSATQTILHDAAAPVARPAALHSRRRTREVGRLRSWRSTGGSIARARGVSPPVLRRLGPGRAPLGRPP